MGRAGANRMGNPSIRWWSGVVDDGRAIDPRRKERTSATRGGRHRSELVVRNGAGPWEPPPKLVSPPTAVVSVV